MIAFARLYADLDATTKTSQKVAAMARYFASAPAEDAAWALWILSGHRLRHAVPSAAFRRALAEHTELPEWLIGECHEAAGDLSEAAALLIAARGEPASSGDQVSPRSASAEGMVDQGNAVAVDDGLAAVMQGRVLPLVGLRDDAARSKLREAWRALPSDVLLVFHKMIRGNLRVGVQRPLVVRAVAQAAGLAVEVVAHRLMGDFVPTAHAWREIISPENSGPSPNRPYPFCLASGLDVRPEDLGSVADWRVEIKWDGIRAQLLRRDAVPGGVAMWSRGEEPIAGQFPEIVSAARNLPSGTVLDGEVVAWRFADGRPLSFNTLQTRLQRKDVQPTLFDAEGVVFLAFDLLEVDGADVRGWPLSRRLERLGSLVGGSEVIRLAPSPTVRDWAEVASLRDHARERWGGEGVMLKHRESRYHQGRVAGATALGIERSGDGGAGAGWWKWKADPYSADMVLIAAQQGSGRRAGLFTDYTFAVRGDDGSWATVAKAYSGLTDEEIRRVDAFIRSATTGRAGPVRLVRPELVFEVSFEGIRASPRHKGGVALRFPRITRWRTDKTPEQADTLAMLRSLLAARERGVGGA